MTLEELLARLAEDRQLLDELLDEGVLAGPRDREFTDEEVERALIARRLVRELEVNTAGVHVILHMRRQILDLRRQMLLLLEQLAGH